MDCFEGDGCMKKFTALLLSIVFVAVIACSIQSISADHETGKGIFRDESQVSMVITTNTNYQVYLQAVLRNGDGQLINVTENTKTGAYIPHAISDYVFDTLMSEKEIITIDNIKYEKAQYTGMLDIEQLMPPSKSPSHFIGNWIISLCQVFDKHGYDCVSPWQANSSFVSLEEDDIVKNYWTILRIIN